MAQLGFLLGNRFIAASASISVQRTFQSNSNHCFQVRAIYSFLKSGRLGRGGIVLPTSRFRHLCKMKNSEFRDAPTSRFRHLCKMKNSDIISQLEMGKPENQQPGKRVNGIFWILLLNIGIYAADHWLQLREMKALYLYHAFPEWYQFITAAFCHASWNHLSSNLFFLYIFGKLVEEEEGNLALWISYIITGAGANLVSWLVLPRNAVSVGASGAVFGLFAISVLVKIRWDWRKILEVLILGQFVIQKVMEAAEASAGLSRTLVRGYSLENVNHVAHLSGALIGVALIWLISRFPSAEPDELASRKKN